LVKWPKLNLAAMNKRSKHPMIQKSGSLFIKQYLCSNFLFRYFNVANCGRFIYITYIHLYTYIYNCGRFIYIIYIYINTRNIVSGENIRRFQAERNTNFLELHFNWFVEENPLKPFLRSISNSLAQETVRPTPTIYVRLSVHTSKRNYPFHLIWG
jgi:hypothetical protein